MTAREAVDKVVAWLAANGVMQPPVIFQQEDFKPVPGFTPATLVEWRGTSGAKLQFTVDDIAHWVEDSNDANLQSIVLTGAQVVLGLPIALALTWADFEKPPAPPANPLEVVGAQVSSAEVSLYPWLDAGRKYFIIANGAYPVEGSKYTAPDGKVYTVVAPMPFKRWLRL